MHILGLVIGTFRVCALSASLVRSFIFVMPLFRNKPEQVLPLGCGAATRLVFAKMQPNMQKALPRQFGFGQVFLWVCLSLYLVPTLLLSLSSTRSLSLSLSLSVCVSLCCKKRRCWLGFLEFLQLPTATGKIERLWHIACVYRLYVYICVCANCCNTLVHGVFVWRWGNTIIEFKTAMALGKC